MRIIIIHDDTLQNYIIQEEYTGGINIQQYTYNYNMEYKRNKLRAVTY